MRRFFTAGALMTAVALAAATAASAAVPSPSYQLGGIALGTSYFGTGIGSTGDRGSWQSNMTTDGAGNLSGTFTLRSRGQQLAGTLVGTETTLAGATGCGTRRVSFDSTLTTADGPMTLTGTVTQFRLQFRGACRVLISTMQGSLAPAAAPEPDPGDPGDPGGQL
jgi:hypothetical protein